jgi:MoxR-like ATPase
LPQPFLVIATQNPVEHHGTYPLPESQLDRFLMRIRMGYPSHETEREILRKRVGEDPVQSLEPVADVADVLAMQNLVAQVKVDSSLHDYALEIVTRTRHSEQLSLGVSPRGTLMLQRAAQARAFLDGRDYCLPDDFKQLAVAVFSHRVVASSRHASLQKKSETTEAVLQDIVDSVRIPL